MSTNNVNRRTRGSWKSKYTVNEDYFKTWSNNMAYILGFFVADGCITKDLQTIIFVQKDIEILHNLRKELNSTHRTFLNEKTGVHSLNINSKIMKEDLIKLHGIHSCKSNIIDFPYVPNEYMSHFIM